MKKYSVYFVFVSLLCFGEGGKIPSEFIICKRSDPDVNSCFAKAVEHALPYTKAGIPTLGIQPTDPVIVDSITIGAGTGSFSVQQKLTNSKIYHVIDTKINKTELSFDAKEYTANFYIYNKVLRVESDYELDGRALLLPIKGAGTCVVEMLELNTAIKTTGEFYEKKGKTYVKLHEVKVDTVPGKVTYKFDNLFNGDEGLGTEMNRLLNENWKEVFVDVKGAYEEALAAFFTGIFNAVFTRIPFDELFPV